MVLLEVEGELAGTAGAAPASIGVGPRIMRDVEARTGEEVPIPVQLSVLCWLGLPRLRSQQ